MDKKELIIQALQQRIGEMSAMYETNIAILRAEITELVAKLEELQKPEEE
jgi:hypothetical protein